MPSLSLRARCQNARCEHVTNRILFKNMMRAGSLHFVQADCTQLAGISEFLAVSLLARKFGLPIVPHVGDMGQIHQHLVLFNHVALRDEVLFLESIPHLRKHFITPARVENGVYITRSEERRVGKESELRWEAYDENKKNSTTK